MLRPAVDISHVYFTEVEEECALTKVTDKQPVARARDDAEDGFERRDGNPVCRCAHKSAKLLG